jgi:hypothetical protein
LDPHLHTKFGKRTDDVGLTKSHKGGTWHKITAALQTSRWAFLYEKIIFRY